MFSLEIRYLTGDVETFPLSKRQPMSIGSHKSNDICIHDDGVDVMHCRVSWSKNGYEVVAANLDGVDLNGTLVRQSPLRSGDLLRIGSVDISLRSDEHPDEHSENDGRAGENSGTSNDRDEAPKSSSEIELQPITEDEMPLMGWSRGVSESPAGSQRGGSQGSTKRSEQDQKPDSQLSTPEKKRKMKLPDDLFDDIDDDDLEALDEDAESEDADVANKPVLRRSSSFTKQEEDDQEESQRGESLVAKLKSRLAPRPVRPGEHDLVRSPIVTTLVTVTAVLALLFLIFWFMIARETATRRYDAAVALLGEKKFSQAVKAFDDFLLDYPQHKLTENARIGLGKAKIEKEIGGATPSWQPGIEAIQDFIQQNQDLPTFPDQHNILFDYAKTVALGAAKAAETRKERNLLKVSEDAEKILVRYSPVEEPPVELQKQIYAALEQAKAAIRKKERFDAVVADVEAAIKNKDPMAALAARQSLLDVYPDFRTDRKVQALLAETLETEKSLITRTDLNRDAITEDRTSATPTPLSLTLHTRSRTDEVSAGRAVFALGKDCCYGIDTITGDPVWRRVIGLDTPFFPISVSTSVPGLLMFDTNDRELLLVDRRTGKLIWRQPVDEDLAGPPLVHEGQIYLPTLQNNLYQIDVDTGRITTRLTFSQKVLAPPALLAGGEHLVLAGDAGMLYTLILRPLACEAVSNFGHKAGSIEAPLLKMGTLVLMVENDRTNSCRLRVLSMQQGTKRLAQVAESRVDGQVRDTPILRGKQLFVPCGDERIAAFTVSDDKDQPPLTPVATHQLQEFQSGPQFLCVGPNDQLWMMSSALRKLKLNTDSITLEPGETAVGLASQPLQSIGQRMYIGRRLPYSGAVFFTQADRDQMTSFWRTIVGSQVLAMTVSGTDTSVCVTEAGVLFRLSGKDIAAGGFKQTAASDLRLPDDLLDPVGAVPLDNGRLAVYCGAPEPRLWTVSKLGQVERMVKLKQPLEADPVVLSAGIVLPLPGKLKLIGRRSGAATAKDYLAPVTKDQKTAWMHLAKLDDAQLITVDSRGKLARIQYRKKPLPHLAEAKTIQLGGPVDVNFCVHDGKIMLAEATGRLQILDAINLETLSQIQLDSPASNELWLVGEQLYVETGRQQLECYAVKPKLKKLWTAPLEGAQLAGKPLLFGDVLVVARQDGAVLAVDPATGKQVGTGVRVHQPLNLGPQRMGDMVIVPSIDGSLHRVESVVETKATAK